LSSGTRQRGPALVLLLLWLAALACALPGLPAAPQPSPTAPSPRPAPSLTPDVVPLAGTAVATTPAVSRPEFAPFRLTPPPMPYTPVTYPFRLDRIANEEALAALSELERKTLAERGFVVVATPFDTFHDLHQQLSAAGVPLLLTAGVALHTLDVIADVAWQRAELQLAAQLQALSEGMVTAAQAQSEGAEDEVLALAAWHNLAYFSVGSRLLNPDFAVPPAVAEIVDEEITLVRQGGVFISPLRGLQMDYGQLQPVGHYGTSPELARYFQARQWYSQPFVLQAGQPGLARQQTRQLALMALALEQDANLARWQRVYGALAYFESSVERGSLAEVMAALTALGGPAVLDGERVDDLVVTLVTWPVAPAVMASGSVQSYAFLPPAAPPAETILPAFVYNRVGNYLGEPPLPLTAVETNIGPLRVLPRVFDAAAALGSAEAAEWVAAGGDNLYEGYDSQLALLQPAPLEGEPDNYATAWLESMRPLLNPPAAPLPYAAHNTWMVHQLNTWFGGWLLLHHTTALASRPVDRLPLETVSIPGFVSAEPELLAGLAALARQLEEGLRQRDLLDEEVGQKLWKLERLYLGLQEVAATSIAGQRLDDDSLLLLAQLGPRLEALLTFSPPGEGVPQIDPSLARQVTTYTDPTSGASMVALMGRAWPIYVIVEREGALWLAAGGIFSTYEQRQEAGAAAIAGPADDVLPPSPWLLPLLAPSP
jgi:hypothetical protein